MLDLAARMCLIPLKWVQILLQALPRLAALTFGSAVLLLHIFLPLFLFRAEILINVKSFTFQALPLEHSPPAAPYESPRLSIQYCGSGEVLAP